MCVNTVFRKLICNVRLHKECKKRSGKQFTLPFQNPPLPKGVAVHSTDRTVNLKLRPKLTNFPKGTK